jgi:hypothetical protein
MKSLSCLLLLLALALPLLAHGPDGDEPSPEQLKKLFPTADAFVARPLKLEGALVKTIEQRLGAKLEGHDLEAQAYVATQKGRSLGAAWMTDVHLKQGLVDVLVGVDLDGKLVGVLLNHSPIPALAQSSYLAQYKGLSYSSAFKIGQDLKAHPKYADASSQLAAAVKKGVVVLSTALLKK